MQLVLLLGEDQVEGRAKARPLALTDVGGISLLQRQCRAARLAGATQLVALTAHADACAAHLSREGINTLPARYIDAPVAMDACLDALRAHDGGLDDAFWIAQGDRVLSPGVFRALRQCDRLRGKAILSADGEVLAAALTHDMLRREDAATCQSLHDLIHTLLAQGVLEREVVGGPELMRVRTIEDGRAARRALFGTLRKPLGRQTDGITAYLINRPISLSISRVLVHTPVTPNHVTGFNILLGLLGGLMLLRGEYMWMALGALMMQLVSIFDGIDGELARMKLLMSHSGEWFDTVADDIVKLAMFAPLGIACANLWASEALMWVTGLGVAFVLATVSALYAEMRRRGLASLNNASWWFEREGREDTAWQRFLIGFSYVLKRDTYTLLLVLLVIFGMPTASLLLMFGGINIVFFATFAQKLNATVKARQLAEVKSLG